MGKIKLQERCDVQLNESNTTTHVYTCGLSNCLYVCKRETRQRITMNEIKCTHENCKEKLPTSFISISVSQQRANAVVIDRQTERERERERKGTGGKESSNGGIQSNNKNEVRVGNTRGRRGTSESNVCSCYPTPITRLQKNGIKSSSSSSNKRTIDS